MAKNTEPDIPDSDELPDEDEEAAAVAAPHDHPHTPGFPDHTHKGNEISYDAGQTYAAGGLEMFPPERHETDTIQAADRERELVTDHMSALAGAFHKAAGDLGWEVERTEHPSKPGGSIFGLNKDGHAVSAEIAYTE